MMSMHRAHRASPSSSGRRPCLPRLGPGAAAVLVAGALLLGGCGSGSAAGGSTTAAGGSTTAAGGGTTPAKRSTGHVSEKDFSSARDAYDLEVARCIRSKGLDVKDPQPGKGIQESSPEIDAAGLECMHQLGDPPTVKLTKGQEAEMLQTALDEAACLRKKGYEVRDPTAQEALAIPTDATTEDVDACVKP